MGSKSVLMAPLLGKHLLDHILFNKKIPDLVDIKRYENLLYGTRKRNIS